MSKRKKVASIAFTGAAAAAVVGLRVTPAAAASSWKMNQPNSTNFTGTNTTSATLDAGGINLACLPGTANATGHVSGNGKTGVPAQLGTISSATFGTAANPCSLLGFGVTAKLTGTIGVNAKAATTGGVTSGWLGAGSVTTNKITASISGVNGFACHMTVSGTSVPASFHNSGHVLNVNPASTATLKIKSVTGCSGLFTSGQSAFFKAAYNTTPQLSISGG